MEQSESPSAPRAPRALTLYFLMSYLAVLVATFPYLREIEIRGVLPALFLGAVWLTYSLLYLLPAIVPVLLIAALLRIGPGRRIPARLHISPGVALLVPAVVLASAVQILLRADRFLFHLYGWHVNGFVLNLLLTPGGVESLGSSEASELSFALMAAELVALQVALAFAAVWIGRRPSLARRILGRKRLIAVASALALLTIGERVTYGLCDVKAYAPVLVTANAFPLYLPMRFRGFAESLGIQPADRAEFRMDADSIRLDYPRKPLRRRPDAPRYNIVWLVSESLRWDMLTEEIMPETYAFAQRSAWFHDHVSTGNGTRMGIFGMFYGLYGPYWFPFREERRGPVLMDQLLADDYQLGLYTSARFKYPEFDETVFAAVPGSELHENRGVRAEGWKRDRENVTQILEFLDGRDPERPFMTFEFFESPHARYYFPPESVIREPYAEDVNYATMDVDSDAKLMFNRYVNACHHLDSQIGRVLRYLDGHELLDETIVVITGDHGEEFMEHGRWGHNSDYVREQVQVPLVLHIPGRSPERIDRLTSHLDIPVTVLDALGVLNPPEDYSLGRDLFDGEPRKDAVVASWNDLVYVSEDSYAVFPVRGLDLGDEVRNRDGSPVEDRSAWLTEHRARLFEIMGDLHRFSR